MSYWRSMFRESLLLYFLPLAVAYRAVKAKLTLVDRTLAGAKVPGPGKTD